MARQRGCRVKLPSIFALGLIQFPAWSVSTVALSALICGRESTMNIRRFASTRPIFPPTPSPVGRAVFWWSLLIFLVGIAYPASRVGAEALNQRNDTIRYLESRVLVQPRAGLADKDLDKVLKTHGGKRGARIAPLNVHVVELPPQANAMAVAKALSNNPHIKYAEVDRALQPAQTTNDPYFGNAWHLPKIEAPVAWDRVTGSGVVVAILDSGVDPAHPDLASTLVEGWNFYDGTPDARDVYGHGTKVAGAAAAIGNNGAGVIGVSWNARIMPLRITDTQGYGYDSLIAQALTYAADHGARVANISFLGVAGSATVLNAAKYMRNKGGVVVVAGGNTGGEISDAPSDLVTAVSATDSNDARPSWSSWGSYIDVAAPGVSVWTTTRGGGYGGFSGTSAASPVAAGVYALMISANPTLSPANLDSVILSTARDLGSTGPDPYYGSGRVNALAAVDKARSTVQTDTQPPSVTIAAPTGGQVRGVVPVDVKATDNTAVARVELYVGGKLLATDILAPYEFGWDASTLADGDVTLSARAYDGAGNMATSPPVTVTVANDTTAPTVAFSNPTGGSTVSGTVPVSVSATDNSKVTKISLTIDGREVAVAYGSSLSFSWDTSGSLSLKTGKGKGGGKGGGKGKTAPTATDATLQSTLVARAEDAAGNASSASVTVYRQ